MKRLIATGAFAIWFACIMPLSLHAAAPEERQSVDDEVLSLLGRREGQVVDLSQRLWDYSELGFLEEKSSKLLKGALKKEGFRITENVAGLPTAFVAEWGEGGPVISILAEYDALPGPRQVAEPVQKSAPGLTGTQACGHNLFGAASTVAAIVTKEWLEQSGAPGVIRLYGTPAEEGGSGKVYMVRDGAFDDVDAAIHWHPDDENSAHARYTLANISAKFRFRGVSSHAASSPEKGRSALDALEAFDMMVNQMREHIPPSARIHYVISHGGDSPNTVPDFAEAYYYVREDSAQSLRDLFGRVTRAAQGAAMGSGVTVDWEVLHGNNALVIINSLSRMMDEKLHKVGGVTYTPEEMDFAQKIQKTFNFEPPPVSDNFEVESFKEIRNYGSTDVGDVSIKTPTVEVRTATWAPGTAHHSWQAAAQSGMSIGHKGAIIASKSMALAAVELLRNQALLDEAKREHESIIDEDYRYEPVLGDREPPLDYRK